MAEEVKELSVFPMGGRESLWTVLHGKELPEGALE